jgi:hypothetical protein
VNSESGPHSGPNPFRLPVRQGQRAQVDYRHGASVERFGLCHLGFCRLRQWARQVGTQRQWHRRVVDLLHSLWSLRWEVSHAVLVVLPATEHVVSFSYTALFPKFISIVSGKLEPLSVSGPLITIISAENDPAMPQILYAFFSFARGVGKFPRSATCLLSPDMFHLTGNIASGPISTALLNMSSE